MKPILLHNFKVVLPRLRVPQVDANTKMAAMHGASLKLVERYAVKETQIGHRYFENIEILESESNILSRTNFFGERAQDVFEEFYRDCPVPPEHIVHVTCTGYLAPSAPQILINKNNWHQNTSVTHAYHMGCYAAFPAIRMAEGFVQSRNSSVDIVHTEMCGLHMDKNDHSPEQWVVQSLFADGHIKYSVGSDAGEGFLVKNILEQTIPNSSKDMSWRPAPFGMQMTLSREVPEKIKTSIKAFVEKLGGAELLKNAIFAIHPGGPKIIEAVQETLNLSEEQVRFSKNLLLNRGNMSSATLPHVWDEILKSKPSAGTPIVSLAFGPGLTVFGGVFEVSAG